MHNDRQYEFLKLLDQCQGTIFKLCLTYGNRRSDNLHDLYQEIVCNLWESYPQFRNASKPNTWVYRIALNTIYMQHRIRRRTPRFLSVDSSMCESIAESGENEMVERFYQLLDMLDKDDRAIITLYIGKIPQGEIAEILHTTESAINHKISRLKQKLKQLNEDEQ